MVKHRPASGKTAYYIHAPPPAGPYIDFFLKTLKISYGYRFGLPAVKTEAGKAFSA
jgi:hypothetical protein